MEFLPPHSHWDPGLFLGESRGIQGYSWGIPRAHSVRLSRRSLEESVGKPLYLIFR